MRNRGDTSPADAETPEAVLVKEAEEKEMAQARCQGQAGKQPGADQAPRGSNFRDGDPECFSHYAAFPSDPVSVSSSWRAASERPLAAMNAR